MANEPTKTDLQTMLTDMTTRATGAETRVAQLTADVASANERADKAAQAVAEQSARIEELETENRELANSLKAYKGSATRARQQVTVLKRELSPQSRPIGALKAARNDEEAAKRLEALEAAFALGPTEILFSDGKRESRELAPLATTLSAWRQTPHHRELDEDIILEPIGEKQQVELVGFALLSEAGEQVGWCALPSPIVIGRSQRMRIPKGSIRF